MIAMEFTLSRKTIMNVFEKKVIAGILVYEDENGVTTLMERKVQKEINKLRNKDVDLIEKEFGEIFDEGLRMLTSNDDMLIKGVKVRHHLAEKMRLLAKEYGLKYDVTFARPEWERGDGKRG